MYRRKDANVLAKAVENWNSTNFSVPGLSLVVCGVGDLVVVSNLIEHVAVVVVVVAVYMFNDQNQKTCRVAAAWPNMHIIQTYKHRRTFTAAC